jgi:predicted DNA-binding transcriptional regulator AlpA
MNDTQRNRLITEKEVSVWLRVSIATLRRWRMLKRGPSFRRLGGHHGAVRYATEDVERYIEASHVACDPREPSGSVQ